MKNKLNWEDSTLLRIKREFSEDEKYKLLMEDYKKMETITEVYKKEVVKLKEKCLLYKTQIGNLQNKYMAICKKFKIEEYAQCERL